MDRVREMVAPKLLPASEPRIHSTASHKMTSAQKRERDPSTHQSPQSKKRKLHHPDPIDPQSIITQNETLIEMKTTPHATKIIIPDIYGAHQENQHTACCDDEAGDSCCSHKASPGTEHAHEPKMALFDACIAPMSPHRFMRSIHKTTALVTHQHDFSELEPLTNIEFAVAETPSENIHAWIKTSAQPDSPLQSVPLDPSTATVLWNSNAVSALYFRAPQELEDYMCSVFSDAMGMSFAQAYLDGACRGEIETFHSRKGHKTNWHFDFQHNFTFQLKGKKRWFLRKDQNILDPIRGATPHFADTSNYDEQMKVNTLIHPNFERLPHNLETDPHCPVREVLMEEGSLLYFPAGMWHKVVAEEDSVSINVSLTSSTWGDVMSMAFDQLMKSDPRWRSSICSVHSYQDAKNQLDALMKNALDDVLDKLRLSNPIPPVLCASEEEQDQVSVDEETALKTQTEQCSQSNIHYHRNPLTVVFPSVEQPTPEEINFSIHTNFGNDQLTSLVENTLSVPKSVEPLMNFLIKDPRANSKFDLELAKEKVGDALSSHELQHILYQLTFFGVLVKAD